MMKHRAPLSAIAFALLLGPASSLLAQQYPSKTVRTIVSFPAGTTVDLVTRLFTPRLTELYNQPFIVENRAGAAGNVGAEFVARSAPDGYTLLSAAASIPSSMSLYKDLPFDFVRDFQPIAMLASSPFALAVHPSTGVTTVQELIKLAKGKPGQLNFASTGSGGTNHLAGEIFNSMAGVKIVHVPYKSTITALPDLVNGNVAMMFAGVGQVQAFARAGKLRILAVSTVARSALMPDVPTVAEAGLPGYDSSSWFALLAPTGTPAGIVTQLNGALVKFSQSREVREQLASQGADPAGGSPQQVATYIRAEVAKFAKVVAESGAKPD